jgi:hypothetical protein
VIDPAPSVVVLPDRAPTAVTFEPTVKLEKLFDPLNLTVALPVPEVLLIDKAFEVLVTGPVKSISPPLVTPIEVFAEIVTGADTVKIPAADWVIVGVDPPIFRLLPADAASVPPASFKAREFNENAPAISSVDTYVEVAPRKLRAVEVELTGAVSQFVPMLHKPDVGVLVVPPTPCHDEAAEAIPALVTTAEMATAIIADR